MRYGSCQCGAVPQEIVARLRAAANDRWTFPTASECGEAADWIKRAVEVLRAVEWVYPVSAEAEECPVCRARAIHEEHAPDCELATLIGAKVAD